MEFNLIISLVDNKKYNKGHTFFTTLHDECGGQFFYPYERKDNQSLSHEFQINLMKMMKTMSESQSYDIN